MPEACNNLGSAYWALGKSAEAIKYYQRAIYLQPHFASPHYNLGNAYLAESTISRPESSRPPPLSIPRNADAFNNLGVADQLRQKPARSPGPHRQATQLQPDNRLSR